VACGPGLTEAEVQAAGESYGIKLPPDLRGFLIFALPISKGWPNWRSRDDNDIWKMLDRPYEGICFDIEHADFWPEDWGPKPESIADAFKIAKQRVDAAPKLVPVFGHRYIPSRPNTEGNPGLSVGWLSPTPGCGRPGVALD